MDGKMLARLGAVVFVGVAITATAIEMTRQPEQPEVRIPRPDQDGQSAPLRPLLRHCRDMGEAATRDPACLKAWAENRDHFLRQDSDSDNGTSSDGRPASGAPTTLFPTAPGEDPIRKDTMPADAPAEPPASPDEGVR